jgi:pimeloyl-ACP methyl ester carboxylesterase
MLGYRIHGEGANLIVMLHGWLSDCSVYDIIIPYFDPKVYSIALADYPGYGRSRQLEGPFTIARLADEVVALTQHLGWQNSAIVSHSMGGMVILEASLKVPGLFRHGVAITPVTASGFPLDADTMAFFRSAAKDDAALANIFGSLTGNRHSASFGRLCAARAREQTTTPAFLAYLDAWTGTIFRDRVGKITLPTTVIAGRHDGALTPDHLQSTWLKDVPNSVMKVIEGAGHYPMLETPVELIDLIESIVAA